MYLTDGLFLDSSQWENRKRKEEENEVEKKRCREKENEMGRRGGEWLSLVQINERWKHKEAVWGCGGLNREDWQKQSSSTVGCLNLHCCCYTPSTPHQSPLMISNITQSFVIALEPNRHCSPWLTLLLFNRLEIHILGRNVIELQLGLVRGEGLSFWLKLTRWQQNILSATTQSRRICLPAYLQEVVMYCGVTWKIEWRHLSSPQEKTNHVGFCACLSRMYQNMAKHTPTRAFTHTSKHQFRHMFVHTNTDTDTSAQTPTGKT